MALGVRKCLQTFSCLDCVSPHQKRTSLKKSRSWWKPPAKLVAAAIVADMMVANMLAPVL
jgi:hypothetical protein